MLGLLAFAQEAEAFPNTFLVQNRPVGDFAAMAATPGVTVLTGEFKDRLDPADMTHSYTDIALVRQTPGWNTIPVALTR